MEDTGKPALKEKATRATRVALESVLGVVLGAVGLTVLFAWVLVDSYQGVNLPTTPLAARYAIVFGVWFLAAVALGYVFPSGAWRWGLRMAIPSIAVLGIIVLLDFGGKEGNASAMIVVAELALGCLGGVVGALLRSRKTAVQQGPL